MSRLTPLRVLIISHPGVIAINRRVYAELAKQTQWNVELWVPESWRGDLIEDLQYQPDPIDQSLDIQTFQAHQKGNGSLFWIRHFTELQKKSKTLEWDVILVDEEPWSLCAFQVYRAFPKTPKLFYTKQNIFKRLPPPFSWIQAWVLRQSVRAISVASLVTETLRQKGFSGPIDEIPHSVETELFFPNSNLPSPASTERAPLRVAMVGRLAEEKGVRTFLDAVEILKKSSTISKQFELSLIGNGPLEQEIRNRLQQQSLPIHFKPAVPHDQMGTLLRSFDLVVVPSETRPRWKEQFGRILIEAWACGAAVIGSDSGEIPRLIQASQGGWVFPEKEAHALANLLLHCSQNPDEVEQKKKGGHQYTLARCTHQSVAKQLAQALSSAVKTP